MMNKTKQCSRCSQEKEIVEFYNSKTSKDGLRHWCKKCCWEHQKTWVKDNPVKLKNQQMKYRYGISLKEFDTLLEKQDNLCALCNMALDESLCVDHNHTTGKVRGIIHKTCNTAIGLLKDNPELLYRASTYLEAGISI